MAKDLNVRITGDTKDLERALARASAGTQAFGGKMENVGRSMTRAGRKMTLGVTLPIVGIGVAATKMAIDFEKSMTNISALVGASDKQMATYRESVLELGKTVPQGPQALADALYFVTSAGFEGEAALRVLEASARAAAAGLGETQTVANTVGSAVLVYGEKVLSAERATDVLLATVREGKAEPEELAEALGRVLAPAEAMGISFDQVGGSVAALTLGGLDAAEAVTGLRGVISTFLKPSKQMRDTLEDAGLSVKGMRDQIEKQGLLSALQTLRDRFGENKDALGKLFPNVRALNAFLSLTGQNAAKNADVLRDVADSAGDTDRAFAKAAESGAFKIQTAFAAIQANGIEMGAILVPVAAQVIGSLSGIVEAFGELDPTLQAAIIGMGVFAAAIGPVLTIVGNLILAVKALGTALTLVSGPLGLLIAGLAVAAGSMVAFKMAVDDFNGSLDQTTEAVFSVQLALQGLSETADKERQQTLAAQSARIGLESSTLAVAEAERALKQARGTGDKLAIERAEIGLKQARNGQKQATENLRTAEATLKKTRADQMGQMTRLRELTDKAGATTRDLVRAVKDAGVKGKAAQVPIEGYAKDLNNAADKARKLARQSQDTNGAMSRSARAFSRAADTAAALSRAWGNVVSLQSAKEFTVRFNTITTVETNRLQGGRAMGGPVSTGSAYMVGERGPEVFVPSMAGRVVANHKAGGPQTINLILDGSVVARSVRLHDGRWAMQNG